jgi:glycosyltransferase involved in cell wall biosynthesis
MENFLITTAKNLSQNKDTIVDIITMDDSTTQQISNLLRFYNFKRNKTKFVHKESSEDIKGRLGSSSYYKCKTFKELSLKLNEYDVVYSKNELLEAFIFKFIIGYSNIPPLIFGCHTLMSYSFKKNLKMRFRDYLYTGFPYKFLAGGVSKFHVLNEMDKKNIEKSFPLKPVVKIYNPFDFKAYQLLSNKPQQTEPFDMSKYNILWVGSLIPQKGIASLLNIINTVNSMGDSLNKIAWNIVGDGESKREILNLSASWKNVNYLGYINSEKMPPIYKNNNLFISTSYGESFGYTILEANAMNTPSISFDIPGPNELIIKDKTGFVVTDENDFVSKIMSLINGEVAFNKVAFYSEEKFKAEKTYLELLNLFKNEIK